MSQIRIDIIADKGNATQALRSTRDEIDKLASSGGKLASQYSGLSHVTGQSAQAARRAGDEYKRLDDDLTSLLGRLDPVYAATMRLDQGNDLLHRGLKEGLIDQRQYQEGLRNLQKEFAATSDKGGILSSTIGRVGLGAAIVYGVAKIGEFGVATFNTGLEVERLNNTLKFSTGSAEAAATEMSYLTDVSRRLGVALNVTSNGYVKLSASAVGTRLEGQKTRDIFEAVISATTVMGLKGQETEGVLLAISQMMSKGTVNAEELRGQLGERLPGAFQVAARAMGVSTAELGKMLQQGEVMAEDFLPKFAAELKKTLGDTPEEAARGGRAAVNQLSTTWEEFKRNTASGATLTIGLAVVEHTDNALNWFNHFVFGKGELADIQRRMNNPGRIEALRSEQELLRAGGNNLDPSNTLERRLQRLKEIAAEIRRLQKEIGITPNGNALPGVAAIGGDVVMPLTAGSQMMYSSGKEVGGGYGAGLDKEHQRQAEAANAASAALAALTREQQSYMTGVAQLGDQIFALNATEQSRIEILQDSLDNMLRMPPEIRNAMQAQLDYARAQEQLNEELARTDELMQLQQKYDDVERARYRAVTDSYDAILREAEDLNVALIKSDTKRAAKQLEIEHERRVQRIAMMEAEQGEIDLLLQAETERFELAQKVLATSAKNTKGFMKDLGLTFKSAFEDAIVGGEKFSRVLAKLAEDIERLLVRRTITEPLLSGFDSILSGFDFNSFFPTNHAGGIAGLETTSMRFVSPAIFSGAPRYHTGGIAGDEVPSILKRGEGVFTREQMRNLAPAGAAPRVTVNLIESAGGGGQVEQRQEADGSLTINVMVEKIESMIGRNIQRGSGIAPVLERQYGLNRAVGAH